MSSVSLHHLSRHFSQAGHPDVMAVDQVDLEIASGEFMVLVGPSGGGKSTVLRMIAGLETPSSGEIRIDGQDVRNVPPSERGLAFVFQHHALYPHLTAYDNIALGLVLRRESTSAIAARVNETAGLLGLTPDVLQRKPAALSGGQRQRVALGRALVLKPKVLLLDEPLSALDPTLRAQMRLELAQLHRQLGTTMIYVTHDQVEAMTLGQRIAVMGGGRLQQVAPPLDVYNHPANLFVARFLGSPPMNIWEGRLFQEGDSVYFTATDSSLHRLRLTSDQTQHLGSVLPEKILLGVRPEDLSLTSAQEANGSATLLMQEPRGAETFLHFKSGETSFVVSHNPTELLSTGETLPFQIPAEKVHLFLYPDSIPRPSAPADFEKWSIYARRFTTP